MHAYRACRAIESFNWALILHWDVFVSILGHMEEAGHTSLVYNVHSLFSC